MSKNNLPVAVVVLCCLSVLLFFSFQNEYCYGGADNYWHYFFSRYAFSHPQLFLHHWGKPVFILLSSPFSQLGLNGIKAFNILCCILSSIICFRFCRELGLKMSWMVIPILVFNPLYFLVSQSALTETLFSLILIYSSYLIYREKLFWGTVLASFLLFSRTEGLFIIPYFGFYLLILKKWKYIPLLASGFLIYACVGVFSGHKFLWFFTENPYSVVSMYGHGDALHFFRFYKSTFGIPHLILLMTGMALLIIYIIKKKEWNIFRNLQADAKVFLLILVPAILFFGFHVYAWKFGKFSSAGLERVMTCIIPLTSVLCMYALNAFVSLKFPAWLKNSVVSVMLFFIVVVPFSLYHFPLKAYSEDKAARDAAEWLKATGKKNMIIYYAHPGVVFYSDRNPFDKNLNRECFSYYKECDVDKDVPFYYFWDSSFSEFSCKTSKAALNHCPNIRSVIDFKEENFQLIVYECDPALTVHHEKDPREQSRRIIHLKMMNDKYVCTDKTKDNAVLVNSANPWDWETYTLIKLFGENQYAIRACNKCYLKVDANRQNEITATGTEIGDEETFIMTVLDNSHSAFRSMNGKFLSLDEKSLLLFAKSDSIGKAEKFEVIYEPEY